MLDAAKAMKLSSKDLFELQIIDEIIPEPLGGAHRDKNLILKNLRVSILKNLEEFKEMSPEDILNQRKNKFLKIGRNKGFVTDPKDLISLKNNTNNFNQIFKSKNKLFLLIAFLLIFLVSFFILL